MKNTYGAQFKPQVKTTTSSSTFSNVPKAPSKQQPTTLKQNIMSNHRTVTGINRNSTDVLQKKPIVEKAPIKKQTPTRQEYTNFGVQDEVKKPTRPMSKGTTGPSQSFRQPLVVEQHLQQCRECGRKFNEKALSKHEKICKKVFSQKRKVFNSAKQRIISKEQIQVMKKIQTISKQPEVRQSSSSIPQWKQESLAFRLAMKQAKGKAPSPMELKLAQQVKETSTNMKQCKFCNRKFNITAAEKHIPFCERKSKEMNARKPTRR